MEYTVGDFFETIFKRCTKGQVEFRSLPSLRRRFVSLPHLRTLSPFSKTDNHYFGVATRDGSGGGKDNLVEIPTLWLDIDFKETPQELFEHKLTDFPLIPSLLVETGGGYHVYWLLKKPCRKEDIPKIENYLSRLASHFGGDPGATDASRILRIPETWNLKYTPSREVVIKNLDASLEYNLSDFDFISEVQSIHGKVPESPLVPGWQDELLKGVPEGQRNEAITRLAGRYLGKGLSRDEILPILEDVNSQCEPPLPQKEIESCLDSVIKTHQRNHPAEENDKILDKKVKPVVNLKLTTLDDVFQYKEPSYSIDPILVEGTVSVLGAYTGIGKSITALSIIKSVITGEPLWGKYPVLKTGPVLLVDEETPQGFLRERIEKMGFNKGLPIYFLHFQDVRLDRDDCFNALMEKIEEVKPVLVVIDSLIRVHRQKEDDAMSMSFVVARLRKIANSGTTVLVIHHHKKGEGPLSQKLRGSSDIPGGVDIEYALVPKDNYLIFSSVKTRTKPLTPIRLKMEATEEKIEVVYQGTEIGERGEVLHEVINILGGGEAGVKEIWERVREEGFEVGERTFRDILRNATGKELLERTADRGKKFYRLNPGWQVGNPIYTCKPAKLEVSEEVRLAKDQGGMVNACQGQNLDNQCLDASLADLQKAICQGDKLNLYEGEI